MSAAAKRDRRLRVDRLASIVALASFALAVALCAGPFAPPSPAPPSAADPGAQASAAAREGLAAARMHIECHGATARGGLPRRLSIEGGSYEVVWDDLSLLDSTIHLSASGYYPIAAKRKDQVIVRVDTTIKVSVLLPSSKQPMMKRFYAQNAIQDRRTGSRTSPEITVAKPKSSP